MVTQNRDKTEQDRSITVIVDPELEGLIQGFVDDWKKDVRTMLEALQRADYPAIREVGHDMKGTGRSCGFDLLTEIGGRLEEAAKRRDSGEIRKDLDALSAYLAQAEVLWEIQPRRSSPASVEDTIKE